MCWNILESSNILIVFQEVSTVIAKFFVAITITPIEQSFFIVFTLWLMIDKKASYFLVELKLQIIPANYSN